MSKKVIIPAEIFLSYVDEKVQAKDWIGWFFSADTENPGSIDLEKGILNEVPCYATAPDGTTYIYKEGVYYNHQGLSFDDEEEITFKEYIDPALKKITLWYNFGGMDESNPHLVWYFSEEDADAVVEENSEQYYSGGSVETFKGSDIYLEALKVAEERIDNIIAEGEDDSY